MQKINYFFKTYGNDLMLSFAICINLINAVIGINNASVITLSILAIFCVLCFVNKTLQFRRSLLITFGFILIAFIISIIRLGFNSYTLKYLAYFVAFGIILSFVASQTVNLKNVLACNTWIGLICVAVFNIRGVSDWTSGALMGLSYGMLPVLFSAITGFLCYPRHRILYLVAALFMGDTIFGFAPRGIWVTTAAFFALIAFYYLCRIPDMRKRRKRKLILLSSAIALVVLVLIYLEPIVLGLQDFFENILGVRIYALWKFVMYIRQGNPLNGRAELWLLAWDCFKNNILFGNGIGYYETLTVGAHSHNLIFQALCEGGIIFVIPIVFMLYRSIRYVLQVNHETPKESYLFFAQLFICGIVMMFYSSTYWILCAFWVFFGYFIGSKKGGWSGQVNYGVREISYSLIGVKHRFNSDHLNLEFRAKATLGSSFEGYNKLSHHAFFSGELGYGSYIGENAVVSGKIGRYCSIAGNVQFLGNTHPVTDFVSSHPCFYSTKKQSGFAYVSEQKFDESPKLPGGKHAFVVGNDVYIGHGATIIGPVVIGDGAVIAANATVTKDVPPYTIVGGTPAKEIKKRFSDEDIEYLMNLKWWDKDRAWIEKYAMYFDTVSELRNAIEEDKQNKGSNKKVAVVLTQPVENNSSSMIRCKGIIAALDRIGYQLTCYCPHADAESVYYGNNSGLSTSVRIEHYGPQKVLKVREKDVATAKSFKSKLVAVAYKLFKKVDVFGASLQYLRYRKPLCEKIKAENFDILLTFSDPMTAHMVGCYCKERMNIKYVQQWGDPLATDVISKTALPKWIRYLIEKRLLKPADRVCYVSPLTCDEQKELFRKQSDKMIFLPTPCVSYKKTPSTKNGRFTVGYFGSYNLIARDIRPLYQAACQVKDCDFLFIGDSDVVLDPQENIQVIGRITPQELESYLEKTDVLICLMNSSGNQVPGKVYHYAGSYKEILFIKDGEFGDKIEAFFSKYNRYTFVNNDSQSIERVLRNYVENGVPAREPVEDFKAENISAALLRGI